MYGCIFVRTFWTMGAYNTCIPNPIILLVLCFYLWKRTQKSKKLDHAFYKCVAVLTNFIGLKQYQMKLIIWFEFLLVNSIFVYSTLHWLAVHNYYWHKIASMLLSNKWVPTLLVNELNCVNDLVHLQIMIVLCE